MEEILDRTWDGLGDAWEWLRGVVLGEWEDDRSTSQVVSDALAGLVLGVGSIITLRDLIAVIVRLAKYPEKRKDVDEWILLIAMLLPLIITLLGAVVAGVGALVGAELGGFLRAVALMLVKKGGVGLRAVLEFLQGHGYGNAAKALGEIKFSRYRQVVVDGLNGQIDRMANLVRGFQTRLSKLSPDSLPHWLPGRTRMMQAIAYCPVLIKQLEELRATSRRMIPLALAEMDNRLAALLAGDLRTATQTNHVIISGQTAPKVKRAIPDDRHPGSGRSAKPEPGNTRRLPERRIVRFHVPKHRQEFKYVNNKGIPIGAKPFHEGETILENPQLKAKDWRKHHSATEEGYPDLTAPDFKGRPTSSYDTFSDLRKTDLRPGDKIVRVVAHDAEPYSDWGAFWTRELPEDGRQLRAGTAVKEGWNKDGSYVELTVPPKGHPVWQELAKDPNNPSLKGWEGPAASQRYEYTDPNTGRTVPDNFYLPGGSEQLYFAPKQMEILKKHGFISDRKPTNFRDYDPTVVNADGSRGNIIHGDSLLFENIPLDRAVLPPQSSRQLAYR
ncbi:hypothetical protein [Aromatoleum evansii]|uniref:hypothetical protein n=1 Tax=Aromatoleum evansii TaxID=59406 RepID=UPI00145DE3D7|nr:hypothetical protein [Aromatoleum evansii]NMG29888.1 hypothetical protein [Aromatoleum evansii]